MPQLGFASFQTAFIPPTSGDEYSHVVASTEFCIVCQVVVYATRSPGCSRNMSVSVLCQEPCSSMTCTSPLSSYPITSGVPPRKSSTSAVESFRTHASTVISIS